ncbi:hypothetical protein EB796_021772 [Bugula neritina]|uniref:Uncharacterized protein n=1 Tax=Bugula neritina TaxID=10212 RepID=A0A7J7J193_BUGNE|nr:hypothetical protein EB796_021772 [Bugula neritina]
MLKYALGFQEPPPTESKKSDLPPQLLNRGKPPPGAGPGMRSQPYGRSEGVNTETTKGGSGGGGVMAMVLPCMQEAYLFTSFTLDKGI